MNELYPGREQRKAILFIENMKLKLKKIADRFSLKVGYAIMCVIFFACALYPSTWAYHEWAVNIGSGVVGTVLTVLLIDGVLKRQERERQSKFVAIATRRLKNSLESHAQLFASVYKACSPTTPDVKPRGIVDLLKPTYFQHLVQLDALARAPVLPDRNWAKYLAEHAAEFSKELEAVTDQYGMFISGEQAEAILNCSHSELCGYLKKLPVAIVVGKPQPKNFAVFTAFHQSTKTLGPLPCLIPHLEAVLVLLASFDLREADVKIPESNWSDDHAPKWGSGRLPPDSFERWVV